jgi:hypothetical protein
LPKSEHKREIRAAVAEPRKGKVDVSFHEVGGAGKVVDRDSIWFQYADDLRHYRLIVENMFEDLVAKTEVERAILERQSIIDGISQLQPIGDFGGRFIADKPVLVEITVPMFEHVNAEGILTLRQQGAHGRTDAASEVENCCNRGRSGLSAPFLLCGGS